MSDGTIAVVVGTRPELIKLAPIVRALGERAELLHTGQHYDAELADDVHRELALPPPSLHVGVGGGHRGTQIGRATTALTERFVREPPALVVVQGDTNATLAGALAANAVEVPLVHVEAGLRSHDRSMPEEHNRVLTDHLADLCCAPTEGNVANLRSEAVGADRVALTGNTIVDVVHAVAPDAARVTAVCRRFDVDPGGFVLATLHRPENVDTRERLEQVLTVLGEAPRPVLLPLHPRTVARVERFGLGSVLEPLRVVAPTGYRDFLALTSGCAYLVSDSGGIQEEASVLRRPVIVLRRSTERPEVLGSVARLTDADGLPAQLRALEAELESVRTQLEEHRSPFGDGRATARILEAVAARFPHVVPPGPGP